MTDEERLKAKIEEHEFLFHGLMLFLKEHGETKDSFCKRIQENLRLETDKKRPPEEGEQARDAIVSNIPNSILNLLDS